MLDLECNLQHYQASDYYAYAPLARGYSIHCLADLYDSDLYDSELADTPQFAEKLYALVQEGVLRSPQSDGKFMDFASFCEKLLQPYYLDVADSFVIALYQADEKQPKYQEAQWVGLSGSILQENEAGERVAQSGLTMVQQAHQGQGIAKALKVAGMARAKALGASRITTSVHPDNHAMLAINRRFGFTDA